MVFALKWKLKLEESSSKEEEIERGNIWLYLLQWEKEENKSQFMKSKIVALSKNEEFKTLLKKKKVSNKYVTIFFGHLSNKNNNKLNISFVTKKKIGNAVKRNKIKRRLRNIMNDATKKISIKFNFSYLVICKPSVLHSNYTNLKEILFQEFKKIK